MFRTNILITFLRRTTNSIILIYIIFSNTHCASRQISVFPFTSFSRMGRTSLACLEFSHLASISAATIERPTRGGHAEKRDQNRKREREREFASQVERASRSINSTRRSRRSRALDQERKRDCSIEGDYYTSPFVK